MFEKWRHLANFLDDETDSEATDSESDDEYVFDQWETALENGSPKDTNKSQISM